MLYALHEALRDVLDEGLDARFERHQRNHELLRMGLEELGFTYLVEPEFRLPQLNAVKLPEGIEEGPIRRRLLDDYDIEVGGGLGAFQGKLWRVGLMGASSTPNHVHALLAATRQLLSVG